MGNSRFDWWLEHLNENDAHFYNVSYGDEKMLVLAMNDAQILAAVRDEISNSRIELHELLISKRTEPFTTFEACSTPPIPDDFLPDYE